MAGLFVLIACQLLGETLRQGLGLPIPGPVIGLVLLTGMLAWRGVPASAMPSLEQTAGGLIRGMGLLFVPAGAGLVAELDVLRSAWLPLAVGLLVSTLASLMVTGLAMHWAAWFFERRTRPVAALPRAPGTLG